MVHRHVMLLENAGRDGHWFYCEGCPALVEVVPLADRLSSTQTRVTASLRVRHDGTGGFTVEELATLGKLWMACFQAFIASRQQPARPGRRRRRRAA